MKKEYKTEEEELKDYLKIDEVKKEEDQVAIIFDGKQYSIRIPRKFVDVLELDTKKDKFLFKIEILPITTDELPRLTGKLIRG